MNLEHVWQTAVEQMNIPAGNYCKWVRPASFVSYDGDVFTVSAPSDEHCIWLKQHLQSKMVRFLVGVLGTSVTLQFIVQPNPSLEAEPDVEIDLDDTDLMEVQAEYSSFNDSITQPDKVVVFPAYFERHLAIIGPSLGSLYLGFRQAVYQKGVRHGTSNRLRISARQVVAFTPMSLRTFRRYQTNKDTWKALSGLVTRFSPTDMSDEWKQGQDGQPHRKPIQYKVAMNLPLTAPDVQALQNWLRNAVSRGLDPLAVLQEALKSPTNELIPWQPVDIKCDGIPKTVQAAALDVLPEPDSDAQPEFTELLNRLAKHLIPDGDVMVVSHYFIKKLWRLLGVGPGWLVVLLRDRAYLNKATGEMRDIVAIAKGYTDMAQMLGLSRPRTIEEWLQNEPLPQFVHQIECGDGPRDEVYRRFQILLYDPLAPEDKIHLDQLCSTDEIGANDTIRHGANGTVSGAFGNRTGANDTISGANGTIQRREWHSISSLNHQNHPNSDSTTMQTVADGRWNLLPLLAQARAHPKTRRLLIEKGATVRAMLSWLLYAAGESGASIRDPVSHAVARLMENPAQGAGGAYDRLADLPPDRLMKLISAAIDRCVANDPDWHAAIGQTKPSRLKALAAQLGILGNV